MAFGDNDNDIGLLQAAELCGGKYQRYGEGTGKIYLSFLRGKGRISGDRKTKKGAVDYV